MDGTIIAVYVAIAILSAVTLREAILPLLRSRPRRATAVAVTVAILWPASPVLLIATYIPDGPDMLSRIVLGSTSHRAT
ncbi:hypothetical protein [Kibdelosporangium phytohabitans]|uniref:Uncharacterized protein n=1 Tax=Kibdelosporangium phytohabitans TaxID=860235 RepID=A0A0N9HK69_9PSEU|nr:hypothetical protein [Kibdelosporangium phytohabitans]ALG06417.1 hypothetical protein AOZ06_05285 [Kibdelosporangium phytohabitans]MBE1467572.1 hypothetical protein [Kibdelosporangium phytohabitans]